MPEKHCFHISYNFRLKHNYCLQTTCWDGGGGVHLNYPVEVIDIFLQVNSKRYLFNENQPSVTEEITKAPRDPCDDVQHSNPDGDDQQEECPQDVDCDGDEKEITDGILVSIKSLVYTLLHVFLDNVSFSLSCPELYWIFSRMYFINQAWPKLIRKTCRKL